MMVALKAMLEPFVLYGKYIKLKWLARHFSINEQWEEAIAAYKGALELDPDEAYLWGELGDALAEVGRRPEADECWHQCIKCHKKAIKRLRQYFPFV